MGNTPTTIEDKDEFAEFDGIETLGYRVLGVQPNSPASKAGLVSFFDFLVGANGEMLLGSGEHLEEGEEYDDVDFPALLLENKGKTVELLVWNIKSQEKRLVQLTPNDDWDGAGLLGVTIKLDNYGGADERLIRVLQVEEGSPASVAGLVKEEDFMLGTTSVNFSSSSVLAAVLEDHIDRVVEIYVYNCSSDVVRVVALMPGYNWGGRGLLGAEVGTGYLHRLPNSCRSTTGLSMERKVRWAQNGNPDVVDSNGGNTDQQILEIEPVLEMELQDDEDGCAASRSNPEGVTRQPHELGNTEITQVNAETTRILTGDASSSQSCVSNQSAVLRDTPRDQVMPDNDATTFFSGPPPGNDTKPAPELTKFNLPAPPKMNY